MHRWCPTPGQLFNIKPHVKINPNEMSLINMLQLPQHIQTTHRPNRLHQSS
jgi:hypothetical protein